MSHEDDARALAARLHQLAIELTWGDKNAVSLTLKEKELRLRP